MTKKSRHFWIVFGVLALTTAVSLAAFMFFRPAAKAVPANTSPSSSSQPSAESGRSHVGKPASESPHVPPVAAPTARKADGSRVAYLTFDDGPSPLTPELLSRLKENGVCATFFIVGRNAQKYPDSLKEMAEDGDVIGVHSWTHDYSYIYRNTNNFLTDFNKLDDYIYQQTGVRTKICRFPGGTNNMVCRRYSRGHIMREIVSLVHKKGFEYYDWNVSLGEASEVPPSREKIIQNVVPACRGKNTVVILFHDTDVREYVDVVPDIIAELREEGFSFGTLAPDRLSPAVLKAVQFIPV